MKDITFIRSEGILFFLILPVPWLDVALNYTNTDEWQKTLWLSVPNRLVTQFSKGTRLYYHESYMYASRCTLQ